MKTLLFAFLILMQTNAFAKSESESRDAQSVVLYGKTGAGVLVPIQTDASGVVETSGGEVTDGDYGDITVSSTGTVFTIDADTVALATDTTGNYVASLTAGTAIDVSAAAEGGTPTIDFDSTELGTTTFGSGSAIVHTYNASGGTDPSWTYGDNLITSNVPISLPGAASFSSTGDITLNLDTDNDSSNSLILKNGGGSTIATFTEAGGVDITAGALAVADTALTAGRSLTLSTNDVLADSELYTDTKCVWWESPVAGDDFKSVFVNDMPTALTVTKLWCESDQTVTAMFQVDDGSAADMDSVDLVCVSTPDTDTSLDGDATIAAGDRVDIDVASVASTPTWVSMCFTYTNDD